MTHTDLLLSLIRLHTFQKTVIIEGESKPLANTSNFLLFLAKLKSQGSQGAGGFLYLHA